MIIGITGKSGSGKSTIASYLKNELSAAALDVDKIGHEVIKLPYIKDMLIDEFGKTILNPEEEINRKELGKIVFSSDTNMKKLYKITKTEIQNQIKHFISKNKNHLIILDYALLPNLPEIWSLCGLKILLNIPRDIRFKRLLERDDISLEYLEKREESSLNYNENEFDLVLNSTGEEEREKIKQYILKRSM